MRRACAQLVNSTCSCIWPHAHTIVCDNAMGILNKKRQAGHAYIVMNQPSPKIPVQPWRPSCCPAIVGKHSHRYAQRPRSPSIGFLKSFYNDYISTMESASCDTLALAQRTPQQKTQYSNKVKRWFFVYFAGYMRLRACMSASLALGLACTCMYLHAAAARMEGKGCCPFALACKAPHDRCNCAACEHGRGTGSCSSS